MSIDGSWVSSSPVRTAGAGYASAGPAQRAARRVAAIAAARSLRGIRGTSESGRRGRAWSDGGPDTGASATAAAPFSPRDLYARAVAVRALVFDVFGTLLDWRSAVSAALRESGVPGDPEELADEWRGRFFAATAEVNEGARPWGDLDELHRATLDEMLGERGAGVAEEQRRRLVQSWHRLEPWPDGRGGLEELRRDHVVAALSNGHIALLVDLVRHADLRFDCLISAELPRRYKPARDVYLTGARLLGVEPGELMLVAAHPADLAGARRAGLRSAFVDRPLEYGPGSPAREDPDATLSVADLHELAQRLS